MGGVQGTLAEYVAVNAALLAAKPKSLSMRQAAALPLVTITAWEGIVDRAKVRSGQKVLVHAGAGGVGHVAVQLAKSMGADVFTTVSRDRRTIAESFGATAIDYRSVTPEQYVDLHTGGEGFDVVNDTVGGVTIDASFAAVKRYTGHVVSCLGWTTILWLRSPFAERPFPASSVFCHFSLGWTSRITDTFFAMRRHWWMPER